MHSLHCRLWSIVSTTVASQLIAAAIVVSVITGCQPDSPSVTAASTGVALGRTAPATTLTVTSTSPAKAPQDTVIDVSVSGSGFTKGASARWSLLGDTTQVHVVSTTYVNSGTLTVRLRVPSGAPVAKYDVVVYLVDGKKGVGAELFAVELGDPKATWFVPLNDGTLGLRSDGLYPSSDGYSVYDDGTCGVSAKIFATIAASNSGDGTMQTDNPRYSDRKCAGYPRKVKIAYGDRTDVATVAANVRAIVNTDSTIAVGSTVRRMLALSLSGTGLRCAELRWTIQTVASGPVNGDQVNVTRLDASTWRVETQLAPNNRAYCVDNGLSYNLPVSFLIVSRRPLN